MKSARLVSHGETSQPSSALIHLNRHLLSRQTRRSRMMMLFQLLIRLLIPITEEPLGSGSDVLRLIQGKYSPHMSSEHFQTCLFVSVLDD